MTDLARQDHGSSAMQLEEVKQLQSKTEDDVRRALYGEQRSVWGAAKENLFTNVLGGLFKGLNDIVAGTASSLPTWMPNQAAQFAQKVKDGQVALNDRTDLLSPLLDTCTVSCPPGKDHARFGSGIMPFNYQIGASKGVTLKNNRIYLNDKGLWNLDATVTVSWTGNPLEQDCQAFLQVMRPNGTLFSEQGYFMSTLKSTTMPIVSSVLIDEPGYYVQVKVVAPSGRGWWTGPKWTRMKVQHLSREVVGGTGAEESTDGQTG